MPTFSEPPESAQPAIARLRASGGPVTEAQLDAALADVGVSPQLVLETDRYRRWLTTLGEHNPTQPLAPWASVPDAVAAGRAEVLAALAAREDATVPCSRLQVARDIGVMIGAFLASGAALAVPVQGGFSRGQVLRHGWRTLLARPRLAARMMRTAWRIDLHTNDRLIHRFDETAWSTMYALLNTVLASNQRVDAVVGTAWYYDERVYGISPHLRYLRAFPTDEAPAFVDFPATPLDTSFALKRSSRRRNAANAGEYAPHATLVYWPREH